MPNITRNNHYVPEATLRRWSDDGVRVYAYRLLVSHRGVRSWRRELISGLTRQTDFYTQHHAGQDVDSFETFITREFEEPGQQAIEKLIARQRMARGDWHAIARFVVTQDLRTPQDFVEWLPRLQREIQDSLESAVEKFKQRVARHRREASTPLPPSVADDDEDEDSADDDHHGEPAPNAFADVLKVTIDRSEARDGQVPVRADIRSLRSVWMARIRHLLTGRAGIVCSHRWTTMVPADGEEWPLTDHPVLRLNYDSPQKYDFGGGWGHPGSEFIMPVTPQLAVYTQVGKRHAPIILNREVTRRLQQLFVERAYRLVLARRPMDWIEQFRPRTVDAERYAAEQEAWRQWHEHQSKDEAEFDG